MSVKAALASASVVIPCWNAEKWVTRAVQSALNQTAQPVEVIAVDDGSSDSTLEVLRAFGNGIKVITGPNRGAASARNIGLAQASGEFVMFLDADDYIEANSLECWLRDARDADLVLGPFELERDGRRLPGRGPRDSSDIRSFLLDWVAGQFTPPCALLWRT